MINGRLIAPDPRDFLAAAALPPEPSTRLFRYWNDNGWWGNQGDEPKCVGYGCAHLLEDGPVGQRGVAPILHPDVIYARAQELDEWPGTDYAGTSVRAGLKVLQQDGYIGPYRKARNIGEVAQALLEWGPVIVGTYWLPSMDDTDPDGFVSVTGSITSDTPGHCYILNGCNTVFDTGRIKNSWRRDRWGRNGRGTIKLHGDNGFERLLDEDGEAWIVEELRK